MQILAVLFQTRRFFPFSSVSKGTLTEKKESQSPVFIEADGIILVIYFLILDSEGKKAYEFGTIKIGKFQKAGGMTTSFHEEKESSND